MNNFSAVISFLALLFYYELLLIGPRFSQEPFTRDDELALMMLANETAVAIENARLFYEDQQ